MNKPLKPTTLSAANLTPRAVRSRNKLKGAVRDLLNEIGFRKLRIQDITERAGVAAGLFYRYFYGLEEIVHEVCMDFMDELNAMTDKLPHGNHPYDQIFRFHRLAANWFAENPGIMRCLFQSDSDYPQFGDVWKTAAHDWNLQVARFLRSYVDGSDDDVQHMAFVLGAMTEGVFFQYFIRHTEDISILGKSPDDIAEMIAVMWYRCIFFKNPPKERLISTQSLTSIMPNAGKITGNIPV